MISASTPLSVSSRDTQQMLAMMGWIALVHFVVEFFIMGTFAGWSLTYDVVREGLLDSTSLTIISSPPIYYFVVRPFITSERKAKAALQDALDAQLRQSKRLEEAMADLRGSLKANEELRQKLQKSNAQVSEVNEATLQRLGADLHDGPAQLLTYSLMRLGKFAPAIASAHGQAGKEDLEQVRSALSDSLSELRNISQGLSLPPHLTTASLEKTIELAVAMHRERTGSRVNMVTSNLPLECPQALKVCVYRVVQESLANAYKHARTAEQTVRAYLDDHLVLEITDQGSGFEPNDLKSDGLGLSGMRSRIEALGGTLHVQSVVGSGTKLTAIFSNMAPSQWTQSHAQAV